MEKQNETAVPNDCPDEEAIALIREGNYRAFEAIMRRHNRRLYRIARAILKDEAEAEDAVQEAYLTAFRKLDDFRGPGGFPAWLSRITANESLMRLRQRPATVPVESLEGTAGEDEERAMVVLRSTDPDPEQQTARREMQRILEGAIDALPTSFRPVFVLRAVEQLTVEETAAALGIAAATVKTRFFRARRLLRRHLEAQLGTAAAEAFPFAGERCDRIVAGVFRRLEALPHSGPKGEKRC